MGAVSPLGGSLDVAFGLGMAWWRGQLLFADDQRCLCGPRHFLIAAARNPAENRSLISFTIWSSVVHAVIMAVQALYDSREHGHLVGDVPALLLVAAVLWLLSPKGERYRRDGLRPISVDAGLLHALLERLILRLRVIL